MRLFYKHRLALWLSAATTSKLQTRAFSPSQHKSFVPRTALARHMSATTQQQTNNNNNDDGHLRVALCQFKVTEDKNLNHENCRKHMSQAIDKGAKLIVLPVREGCGGFSWWCCMNGSSHTTAFVYITSHRQEIWASPYATAAFPDYAERMPSAGDTDVSISPSAQVVQEVAKKHGVWIVGGSVPERDENDKIYNTCLVFDPEGRVVAKHRKVHLFDIDVPGGITFFESETLSAGNSMTSFETPWCPVGVGICYDIRFPAYAMLLRQETGCKILIYPGAFNMTTGPAHWELLQRARALDNQCFVLTASHARTEEPADGSGKYPHYTAWGHSSVVSPWGQMVATTDEKEDVVVADLDLSLADSSRQSIPISKQARSDLYKIEKA